MTEAIHWNRRSLLRAAAAACTLRLPDLAAQEITKILVGFPAGGAIDSTARIYADADKDRTVMVVDNRPGAAGNIAAAALAQSRPDGRTVMFAPVNVYSISQSLYRKLAFDTQQDFAYLGIVARFPWSLAVHPSVPAQTLTDFVAWLKANREKAVCGMAATGSEGHLMAFAFSRAIGVDFNFVAYKGGAPMAQDLMAGHIPFAFDPVVNLAQPHKAGKVRLLAVTSTERGALLPDVPTFQDLGYPGATGDTWIGASMRAGTPPAQVQALAASLSRAARTPEVQSRLAALGLTAVVAEPALMGRTIQADAERYAALIKTMGLKID